MANLQNKPSQIFVCNVDGSGLTQLTPNTPSLAVYHQFPNGKSGYDVSKQIVLDQVKWQKQQDE